MVLLGSKDPAPFSIVNADSSSNLLFTSDHNGSAIPTKLKNLGVPLNELRRHVAYDRRYTGKRSKRRRYSTATDSQQRWDTIY